MPVDQKIIKDFQEWASKNNYTWSGALDVWIGAYNHYAEEQKGLREIVTKYNETMLINSDLRAQINQLKHLIDFIDGNNRL